MKLETKPLYSLTLTEEEASQLKAQLEALLLNIEEKSALQELYDTLDDCVF